MPPHGWSTSSSTTFTYSFTTNTDYRPWPNRNSTYSDHVVTNKKPELAEPSDDDFDAMLAEAGVVCLT